MINQMSSSMRNFMEAYSAVHNKEAKEEFYSHKDEISEMDFSLINQTELDDIAEEVLEELFEEGYSVEQCEAIFEEVLIEARVTYGSDTESPRAKKMSAVKSSLKGAMGKVKEKAAKGAVKSYGAYRSAKQSATDKANRLKQSASNASAVTVRRAKDAKAGIKSGIKGMIGKAAKKVGDAANKVSSRMSEGTVRKDIGDIYQAIYEKKLDPVGQEDGDIDNDGDEDSSDKYLSKRRKAIAKSMGKKGKCEKCGKDPCECTKNEEVEEYIDFLITEGYDCSDLTWNDMYEEYQSLDEGLRSAVKRLLGGKKKEEPAKPMSRGDELRKKYNVGPERSDTSAKAQILKKTRARAERDQKEFGGSRYSKGVADRSKAAYKRQLEGGYSKYGANDARGSGNKARKRAAALTKEELEQIEEDSRRTSNKQHTARVKSNIKSFGSDYTPPSNYDPDANRGKGEVLTRKQVEKKRRKSLRKEELEATGLFTVKEIEGMSEEYLDEILAPVVAGTLGAVTGKKDRKVKKAIGAGSGAAIGGALGGPLGAAVGGLAGGAIADEVQHKGVTFSETELKAIQAKVDAWDVEEGYQRNPEKGNEARKSETSGQKTERNVRNRLKTMDPDKAEAMKKQMRAVGLNV
jgi:hypothetical protein